MSYLDRRTIDSCSTNLSPMNVESLVVETSGCKKLTVHPKAHIISWQRISENKVGSVLENTLQGTKFCNKVMDGAIRD